MRHPIKKWAAVAALAGAVGYMLLTGATVPAQRATIMLALGAKAGAFLAGRGFVTPQDVKDVAPAILRHRVIISYEAEAEERTSDDIVKIILDHVPVP